MPTHLYVTLEEEILTVDNAAERVEARRQMREAGVGELMIWQGGPDEPCEATGHLLTSNPAHAPEDYAPPADGPSFEDKLDALTDVQRAYIAAALDAFDATMPADSFGVTVEDLDDDTLDTLIVEANALPEQTDTAAAKAGATVAARLYLHHTGNPALPHTCRTLLRFVEVGS
jgi:hypothetical protein